MPLEAYREFDDIWCAQSDWQTFCAAAWKFRMRLKRQQLFGELCSDASRYSIALIHRADAADTY
jgi:hypothetical protein